MFSMINAVEDGIRMTNSSWTVVRFLYNIIHINRNILFQSDRNIQMKNKQIKFNKIYKFRNILFNPWRTIRQEQ